MSETSEDDDVEVGGAYSEDNMPSVHHIGKARHCQFTLTNVKTHIKGGVGWCEGGMHGHSELHHHPPRRDLLDFCTNVTRCASDGSLCAREQG